MPVYERVRDGRVVERARPAEGGNLARTYADLAARGVGGWRVEGAAPAPAPAELEAPADDAPVEGPAPAPAEDEKPRTRRGRGRASIALPSPAPTTPEE